MYRLLPILAFLFLALPARGQFPHDPDTVYDRAQRLFSIRNDKAITYFDTAGQVFPHQCHENLDFRTYALGKSLHDSLSPFHPGSVTRGIPDRLVIAFLITEPGSAEVRILQTDSQADTTGIRQTARRLFYRAGLPDRHAVLVFTMTQPHFGSLAREREVPGYKLPNRVKWRRRKGK